MKLQMIFTLNLRLARLLRTELSDGTNGLLASIFSITNLNICRKIKLPYIYLDLKPCITSGKSKQKRRKPIEQKQRLWYNQSNRWMGVLSDLQTKQTTAQSDTTNQGAASSGLLPGLQI